MNCRSAANIMDLHLEGRLTPKRAREMESHMKDCSRCSAEARSQKSLRQARLPATGNFKESLKKILAGQENPSRPPAVSPRFRLDEAAAVLAAAALCAGLTLLFNWIGPGVLSQKDAPGESFAAGRFP